VNLIASISKLFMPGLDLLFPRRCVGCGAGGNLLCPQCQKSLRLLDHHETHIADSDGIRSLFAYDGVMRQAILQLKYHDVKALAVPLAQLLKRNLDIEPLPCDALIPVPIHPRRLRERGYNQSALIARELSKLTTIPLVEGVLMRRRNTPPQAKTFSLDERQRNVDNAFHCRGRNLKGKRICLIDDVCTSGATLSSCSSVLKAAGATAVWGLTLAKEV
jgi:ComF family protein